MNVWKSFANKKMSPAKTPGKILGIESVSQEPINVGLFLICSITFFFCFCGAIYRRVLLFVCGMNHIPPYLFMSRVHEDDVRDNDFRFYFTLCYLMLTRFSSLGNLTISTNFIHCTWWKSFAKEYGRTYCGSRRIFFSNVQPLKSKRFVFWNIIHTHCRF